MPPLGPCLSFLGWLLQSQRVFVVVWRIRHGAIFAGDDVLGLVRGEGADVLLRRPKVLICTYMCRGMPGLLPASKHCLIGLTVVFGIEVPE